ncbi:MAG: phospholipase C, phosphocholine-specific [Ferruginibacter sp.]
METRRSFLQKAGLLSGGAALMQTLPESIQKALAINPAAGSSFYDAEHIVFLMQENRSFDHALGTLQGVRGYNDPRAITLPDNNKVWLQTDANGNTYAPFHLDIKNTKITWMGCLPHAWDNQVDARNGGKHDRWLQVKNPGGDFNGMPLTLGHYTRADIPFYYSLADAFTVCDQNFCSVLTGTTPNRLYFWSGTIREKMEAASQANVWNENADHGKGEVNWKTYPERLEDNGISWKVYQNEIYADVGLGNNQQWLDNFGDNPLEYFKQYNIKLHPEYIDHIPVKINQLKTAIAELENKIAASDTDSDTKKRLDKSLVWHRKALDIANHEQATLSKEKLQELTGYHKRIHEKAFTNNRKDPYYHEVTSIEYMDGETKRKMDFPKGDILYQFRQDVENGTLPTVSWLAAPQYFSDHPDSPWFGAWYVSEVMDILTKNPEVWKKTIFILTYDENDGYFDHIPPFGPPNPYKENTGKVSAGIDTTVEFARAAEQSNQQHMRKSNLGLGFRVPMIIASPWTRGGFVCSEVFDHTSSLQFLEKFLEKKTGKKIIEENITAWRRTVCGDLSSAFRIYNGEKVQLPAFLDKEQFTQMINNAQYKGLPPYKKLSPEEIAAVNKGSKAVLPHQEKGTRSACALPYELFADGNISADKTKFEIQLKAGNKKFGSLAAGSPFYVYTGNVYKNESPYIRNYAVKAGDTLKDEWILKNFENDQYHLKLYGPNGFYRSFKGNAADPLLDIYCSYENNAPTLIFTIFNKEKKTITAEVTDMSYKGAKKIKNIPPGKTITIATDLSASHGWYDLAIKVKGNKAFEKQFAGHIENGNISKTDPLMGGIV